VTPRARWRSALSLLAVAFLASSCVTPRIEHEIRITLRDPTGRLGPPPWTVGVNRSTSAFNNSNEWVLKGSGDTAAPGAPYVGHFSTEEIQYLTWTPRSTELDIALVVPALASRDWWRTIVLVEKDGSAHGYARRSAFGELSPKGESEVVMLRGTARPRNKGWSLDLTIDIPPARPVASGAAAAR
jgi:hypothetical protein